MMKIETPAQLREMPHGFVFREDDGDYGKLLKDGPNGWVWVMRFGRNEEDGLDVVAYPVVGVATPQTIEMMHRSAQDE